MLEVLMKDFISIFDIDYKHLLIPLFFIGIVSLATLVPTKAYATEYGDFYFDSSTCTVTGWACDNNASDFGTGHLVGAFFVDKDWGNGNDFLHITQGNITSGWGTANSNGITANSAKGGAVGPSNSYCGSNSNYAHWFKFKLPGLGVDNMSNFSPYVAHTYYLHAVGGADSSNPTIATHASLKCAAPATPSGGTVTPGLTPSSTPTQINIALQLPGIGVSGNLSPKHTTRTLHVSIYAADVDPSQPNVTPLFDSKTLTVTYNSSTGYFTNNAVSLGNLATGDYQLLVKVPGYLRKAYTDSSTSTKTIHITNASTTLIPAMTLVAGDIGPLYNVMDASDFYALVGCYQDKASSSSCAVGSQIADINDDGVVDGIDLNYWLLGFQALVSNNDPQGNGDGVTGD